MQPTMPRRSPRQQNRANLPANTPSEYWKRALFYVFMDHLIHQLDERLFGAEDRYQEFFLLPFRLQQLDNAKIASIYETSKTDNPGDLDFFKGEAARWQLKWGMNANLPSSIVTRCHEQSSGPVHACHLLGAHNDACCDSDG